MLVARQADARAHPDAGGAPGRAPATAGRCVHRSTPDNSRPIPSAAHTRPGPRARSASRESRAVSQHELDAFGGFERADQHRGAHARLFGGEVEREAGAVDHAHIGRAARRRTAARCW